MPDMFVQDILDPEEIEKRTAWNKRMDLPILINLDNYYQKTPGIQSILSGEFVGKINPESYRISDNLKPQNLTELIEDLKQSTHFSPVVCLLVDGTGFRNDLPDNVLPSKIIVLNRKIYTNIENLGSDIKTLISIFLSKKGIGKKSKDQDFGFSKQNPFYIFVSSYNDDELRQYMDEASKVAENYDSLIKVVGFLVPKVG